MHALEHCPVFARMASIWINTNVVNIALMDPKCGAQYGNELGSPAGASAHNQAIP